jgi:hypothetical protein
VWGWGRRRRLSLTPRSLFQCSDYSEEWNVTFGFFSIV